MRSSIAEFQLLLLLPALISAHPSDTSPFLPALGEASSSYSRNDASQEPEEKFSSGLLKRQFCPPNYNYCSAITATNLCCSTDSICSLDNAGNGACCPIGSFCTGTIAVPTIAPATTTNLITTTNSGLVVIITSTIIQTTPTITPAITATASGITYVPNNFFPFPYVATSYANSAACASAYSGCAANFAACTASLQGGTGAGFGVTVVAPNGGGITLAPSVGVSLGSQNAASVCSSLSGVACPGSGSTCGVFGTNGAAVTTVVVNGNGARALASSMGMLLLGMAVSSMIGFVGWLL